LTAILEPLSALMKANIAKDRHSGQEESRRHQRNYRRASEEMEQAGFGQVSHDEAAGNPRGSRHSPCVETLYGIGMLFAYLLAMSIFFLPNTVPNLLVKFGPFTVSNSFGVIMGFCDRVRPDRVAYSMKQRHHHE
jgi:hypothetical protein